MTGWEGIFFMLGLMIGALVGGCIVIGVMWALTVELEREKDGER
jgi:hypothetical protein